jgi:hypothetical protein
LADYFDVIAGTSTQWRRQGWPGWAMAHPKITGNY